MRLLDIILNANFKQDDKFPEQIDKLKSAQLIVADNVAKYFFEGQEKEEWSIKDFPNLAPPFDNFFIEWRNTTSSNMEGKKVVYPSFVDKLITGIHFLIKRSDTPPIKWGYTCIHYMGNRKTGFTRYPFWGCMFTLDEMGRIIDFPNKKEYAMFFDKRKVSPEMASDLSRSVAHEFFPALLTISFLHCKNVIVKTEVPSQALSNVHSHKTGRPLVRYKILEIEPMKRILRSEGQSEKTGLKKSLHICRGHFKNYEQGHGLFGRIHGMYWWESHVRGSVEEGITAKDYNIMTPPPDVTP